MYRRRQCHRLPRFRPEEAEQWLEEAETRLKEWKDPHDLKYAMILKAFDAEDLCRLLREEPFSIHHPDCVVVLLWCINIVFVKW